MTTYERVVCTTCGEKTAISAEQIAEIRSKVRIFPPALVPNLCVRCAMKDPALGGRLEAWFDDQWKAIEQRVRGALVRPLEAIDRFVESLK
jgi:hypothetical protein